MGAKISEGINSIQGFLDKTGQITTCPNLN